MPGVETGISPRGGLALLQSARAWALMDGRQYVIPEDVQACLEPVCGHRLTGLANELEAASLIQRMLDTVDII